MYTINDAYQDVKLFNSLAGNLKNVPDSSIDAQLGFNFEELCEAIESFELNDKTNFLKEVCDMFVVLSGLMQKMESQGYDVTKALELVNANNLTKFPKLDLEHGVSRIPVPIGQTVVINEQHSRYMFKDSNGKIKKPADYKETDLTGVAVGEE